MESAKNFTESMTQNFHLKMEKRDEGLVIEIQDLDSLVVYTKVANKESFKKLDIHSIELPFDNIYEVLKSPEKHRSEASNLSLTTDGKLLYKCEAKLGPFTSIVGFFIEMEKQEMASLHFGLEKLKSKVFRLEEEAKKQEERLTFQRATDEGRQIDDERVAYLEKKILELENKMTMAETFQQQEFSMMKEGLKNLAKSDLEETMELYRNDLIDKIQKDIISKGENEMLLLEEKFKAQSQHSLQNVDSVGRRFFSSFEDIEKDLNVYKRLSSEELVKVANFEQRRQELYELMNERDTKEGMTYLIENVDDLVYLQALAINFSREVTDKEFELTIASLEKLENLKTLGLVFFEKKITDEGLKSLSNSLASLTSLQHLKLNLQCNKIYDEGLEILSNNLSNLTSLKTLKLNFDSCYQISDEGLKSLSNNLASLTSLQHLKLNFNWCEKITDEGLKTLLACLANFKSLQTLSFHFNGWEKISDEGLKILSHSLTTLPSLQTLKLNFDSWRKISDEGLTILSKSLAYLTSLEDLRLNFSECYQISDEGIRFLPTSLKNLTSLRRLKLHFTGCEKISDEVLKCLANSLNNFTSLTLLNFNFINCPKITEKGYKPLKELQEQISNPPKDSKDSEE